MKLKGTIALVTGASRGVGRGIAIGLGEQGATVLVTGRTTASGQHRLPGTIHQTAEEVTRAGGAGIAIACDHSKDEEIEALFARIRTEHRRLDILVNNVFSVPGGPLIGTPFWEQPISQWDEMHSVGLRSHYVASVHAAKMMVPAKSGLIANVSSPGGGRYAISVAYGVGKAAVDRLAADMAYELRPHGITAISLWPGIVKTERLIAMGERSPFPLDHAESPELSGRVLAAFATDPKRISRTGQVLIVASLAQEYGVSG